MQADERLLEPGPGVPLHPVWIDPLVEIRDTVQRSSDEFADLLWREACRHRIDRFDLGKIAVLFRIGDVIGMHDLPAALVVADLAGGDDGLADLERLFEPLTVGVEIGERDEAGVVAQADSGGEFQAGVFDLVDRAGDGGDLSDLDLVDGGAVATVDPAGGKVEEQVEPGLAADQTGKMRAHLRPDPGKARQVIVEGEKDRVAHVARMVAGLAVGV